MSDLEQALREGGEKVGEGRIRIDSARALQRLRDFRFADPAHWVLEVLRAAVDSHATRVEVETDADDVIIQFDGEPFPQALMPHLLEQALNPGTTADEKRTRLLALGAAGALGAGAVFVTVESGGTLLTLTPNSVETTPSKNKRTRVHLHKGFGWRVVSGFFRGSPEARAVTEKAHRYPTRLVLNRQSVVEARPFELPSFTRRTLEGPGWKLELSLPKGPPLARSTVDLDVSGVLVAARSLELPGVQVEAWARADGLRRNASGSDVVDDDDTLQAVLKALRSESVELLEGALESLCAEPVWRKHFTSRLLLPELLSAEVKALLEKAPLLPGPSQGEWFSLAAVRQALQKDGRIHVAKRPYVKGSYPEPTILIADNPELAKLLPDARRFDVEKLVKQKERIAENRARFESTPVEPSTLAPRDWNAHGPITGTHVAGEIGFDTGLRGAFVRVLNHGRLVEASDLDALTPLRLRAVVDLQRPLGDSFFQDDGGSKVLGAVLKHVEAAALRVVCDALPDPAVLPHAFDLIVRLVSQKGDGYGALPDALRTAPLFPCLERPPVSLAELWSEPRWRFTAASFPRGLLDGSRVLSLEPKHVTVLKKLGGKRLEDVTGLLELELDVRRRMAEGREVAEVDDVVARVSVDEPGLRGEVGIPFGTGNRLSLTLLKQGLRLESTELTARYSHAVAVIDDSAFTPNAKWTAVARDAAFTRVSNVLAQAQRKLVLALLKQPRSEWRTGGEQFFASFLSKELNDFDPDALDDVTRVVAAAKVFNAGSTALSLLEIRALPRLLVVGTPRPPVPAGLTVLSESPVLLDAVSKAVGRPVEDARPELDRFEARRRFEQSSVIPLELPAHVPVTFTQRIDDPDFTAVFGLRDGIENEARARVLVGGRDYAGAAVTFPLPLLLALDFPKFEVGLSRELTASQLGEVRNVIELCGRAVLRAATSTAYEVDSRRAILLALGRNFDGTLPKAEQDAVRGAQVFRCTDGVLRDLHGVTSGIPQYVEKDLRGTLPDGVPILFVDGLATKIALGRWSRSVNVETSLQQQLVALKERAKLEVVEEVHSKLDSPWRHDIAQDGLVGEVVIARENAGQLELYFERKPLCVVPKALPAPFAAAIDTSKLTPKPGFKGVVEDAKFTAVVDAVKAEGERLAREVATQTPPPGWAPTLVQLGLQLAAARSWEWKGKTRTPARKKKKAKEPLLSEVHPLHLAPLLRSNLETPLRIEDLVASQLENGSIAIVNRAGTFLETGHRVWWPRPMEDLWAEAAGFKLVNVSEELSRADSLRNRFRFERIVAPLESTWREPVKGPGLEGEVAINATPTHVLQIDVLFQRMVLERWTSPHPVGGVAMVDGATLTPNDAFSEAKRDAQFKALIAATESALERLVIRRLERPGEGFSAAYAHAAVKWRAGRAGALGALVPSLPVFESLSGARLTVGEVMELSARQGRVPLARPMERAPDVKVVLDTPDTRALLKLLDLRIEDVSGELARAEDLKSALTARRLDSLSWKGEAVVRVSLEAPLKGELALSNTPGVITLARDGIAIQPHTQRWPGVVGVVDLEDLAVSADWSSATPNRAQSAVIKAEVERLYGELAKGAGELREREREVAAAWALSFLQDVGVESAAQLRTLTGAAAALCDAPFFLSTGGVKVNLRAVAAEFTTFGKVAVFTADDLPSRVESCVLSSTALDAPWVVALERLFGKTRVWRVSSPEEWQQSVREADPPEGTALLTGLKALRKELRLLRAGALGTLTPNELEDVRFDRAGGGRPMRYDEARKLVFLDPGHPDVKRALTELGTRPERLWVLLAAVFGLVNRELERVTDADETQLLMALAGHLASNPKLLKTARE